MSVQWSFEADVVENKNTDNAENPMLTVFMYGKYIGQRYGDVMRSQRGRKYMKWLQLQKSDDEQWDDAHQKRQQRIEACFKVYQDYLDKQKSEIQ